MAWHGGAWPRAGEVGGGLLVAGAGPAGLTLALLAHAHGADVPVMDRRPGAFRPSRALVMHARTLEVLRPLGLTQALLARADTAPAVDLHLGRRVVRASPGDLALPDTAYPHVCLIRQMDVERVLERARGPPARAAGAAGCARAAQPASSRPPD
jgi:2-polyprenyl-6-methoxyphenol hydroxylase-like FAD-dependent oxidoreductase